MHGSARRVTQGRPTTGVLLLALVLCLLIATVPVLAAIPAVTGLGSSTHPDDTVWYPDDSPSFEWSGSYPSLLGSVDTTGFANDVAVFGNVAYVADLSEGLASFDITDPSNPVFLGSVGAGVAEEVRVAGDVVYVAGRDSGLFAIDVSDPEDMSVLDIVNSVDGANGGAWSVDVSGDMAYITSESDSVLRSIDVSDPENMSVADTLTMNHLTADVTVAGDVAYVAENDWGMHSVDVSDPYNLVLLDTYSASGVKDVEVAGDVAYLSINSIGFRTVDISDPQNMSYLDHYEGGTVYGHGLAVAGDLVLLSTGTSGVQAFDVSDPSDVALIGEYDTGSWSYGVAVHGDVAFVAAGIAGLVALDITDYVLVPSMLDRWTPPGGNDNGNDVVVEGDIAFVANDGVGLTMVDISDPEAVSVIASFNTTGSAYGVTVAGDVAYVADWAEGFVTVDVSDPANPGYLGSWETTNSLVEVAVSGDVAYLATQGDGLQVLDVSDPSAPTYMGSYVTGWNIQGIEIHGDIAYVVDRSGLNMLDVSDPSAPGFIGKYLSGGLAWDVDVEGDFAYVADHVGGLKVVDVSEPGTPTLAGSFSTSGSALDVKVAGNTVYVAAGDGAVTMLDISDPTTPSDPVYYNNGLSDIAQTVALAGDVMYVAYQTSGLEAVQIGAYPAGYSYELDANGTTDPDTVIDSVAKTKVFTDVDDGEWYFHVRSVDRFGTVAGATAHRKVMIDTTPPPTTYTPIEGTNRYETALATSQESFGDGTADCVVITTGMNWPDALGGAALAAAKNGPILLTRPTALSAGIITEIGRLGASEAIVLGSTDAVSQAVEDALIAELGAPNVSRIGGDNRYETAEMIAQACVDELDAGAGYDGTAFVTTGFNFPDALAASPLSAAKGWPIYLTPPTALKASTEASMAAAGVTDVLILGSDEAVFDAVETDLIATYGAPNVTRLEGDNRYATGVVIATYGVDNAGLAWDGVAISTGLDFPDALAGGVLQGRDGSVLLLTPKTYLHTDPAACLTTNRDWIARVKYLGSTDAVSQDVRDEVAAILH